MSREKIIALAFVAAALAGCSKPDANKGVASTQPDPPPAAAASAAPANGPLTISIPKLGLKGLGAGETEAPIVGDGDPILVMASSFTVDVSAAKGTDPKTMKDGQKASKMFNPQGMITETLPDGWALTFTNTGSAGTNYFVSIRRQIGGKGYMCESAQSTPDQQKAAVAFCKSLTSA
jgi:hypothetical protein